MSGGRDLRRNDELVGLPSPHVLLNLDVLLDKPGQATAIGRQPCLIQVRDTQQQAARVI